MPKEHLNPPGLPQWAESFSKVVAVRGGETSTIYVSGQVAVDEAGRVIGEGDLAQQARKAFQNLATALAAAGARPEDVVRIRLYLKHYERSQALVIRGAMREVF